MSTPENTMSTVLRLIDNRIRVIKENGAVAAVRCTEENYDRELLKGVDGQVTCSLLERQDQKLNLSGSKRRKIALLKVVCVATNQELPSADPGRSMRDKLATQINAIIEECRQIPYVTTYNFYGLGYPEGDLNLPLRIQGHVVIIERSLNDWKLREALVIDLKKILDVREKGVVDYIVRSCLNERASMIPYIFDNQTLVKLARHFLRHGSGSYKSCMTYSVNVKKYAVWLGYSPDLIIQDIKLIGAIPDPLKVQNHCGFLNDYLAELQDSGLKPSSINNCIKAVKTFYSVNGAEVKLNEKLRRTVAIQGPCT